MKRVFEGRNFLIRTESQAYRDFRSECHLQSAPSLFRKPRKTPKAFSFTEAEKVQPDQEYGQHDSINRLVYRLSSESAFTLKDTDLSEYPKQPVKTEAPITSPEFRYNSQMRLP